MSDEDFDTANASSVHLQDLSKLVSAFNEKRDTAFQVKNDGQDSGFHASDGVTTVTTTLKVDSNSKDRGLTMSTFRRDRAAKLNWIQHVPSKESSNVIFKEGFNGISTECRELRSLADSVPSTGTDSAATEGTRNSLYLINELCDRLVTNDPQNNKNYADNPTTTETTFLALETPFNRASQLSYPGARETVLSAPNATSNHYGFYTNSQQLSAEQISPLKNTTYFEPEQSNNSVTAPKERHGIECAINVNENTEEDFLDQRDRPLNTSEPIGAISHMQQMLERLTPPVELRGVAEKQGSGSTSELSRGNVFQCTSLSSFEGRNTGASSSATPSTHSTSSGAGSSQNSPGKYSELLAVIEELGKDIRPTYAGSKNAAERLKKGIMHARVLVRECLVETEKCARQ